ncbi:MAG: putative membrane protein YhdT [Roseivirga sp.]|jgi:uncharacterized membrane protein YhdT
MKEGDALRQYTNATRLIRLLKLALVLIFGLIVFQTIQNVLGHSDGLGAWFLPATLSLIFLPILFYIIKSIKKK